MKKDLHYTYELINSKDNKVFYVGKGKHKRMYVHYTNIKNGKHLQNKHLENKIKKIIRENHKIIYNKVIQDVSKEVAFAKEKELIKLYGLNNLCNLTAGGEGGSYFGRQHSEETKKKIGNSNKGKKKSLEAIEKNRIAHLGKQDSKKTKIKKSNSQKKRYENLEERKKVSIRMSGKNNPFFGKKLTHKHKEKISKSIKKLYTNQEYRKMISEKTKQGMNKLEIREKCAYWKNKKQPKEMVIKRSLALKNKPWSEKRRNAEIERKYI
ncbi:MAG: hypothetical protein JETCAE03_32400 [Ignavibacteriaceae bacterium]|jgi:hypothetical protein|nr:MAG: hypothetical protein JETCAE03_32400 [Ignavibacteriaceae bacterium]